MARQVKVWIVGLGIYALSVPGIEARHLGTWWYLGAGVIAGLVGGLVVQ